MTLNETLCMRVWRADVPRYEAEGWYIVAAWFPAQGKEWAWMARTESS